MLTIERARESQYDDYFFLRCDENNILWSGHPTAPDYDKLKKWYYENIQKTERHFFLCYNDQKIAGYLYLDHITPETLDVGYGVHHTMTGKGLGGRIIEYATAFAKQTPGIKCVTAWVADENIASVKVFLKNAYCKTNETRSVRLEKAGQTFLFHKYELKVNG